MALEDEYFVPDPELLVYSDTLPYSLYVNSSALEHKMHFVRIVKAGDEISRFDFTMLKAKFSQIYLSELDRSKYIIAACKLDGKTEIEQVTILKSSAIERLDQIFVDHNNLSAGIINETLAGCRQTVEGFVELVRDFDLSKLHELIGNLSFHDFYTYDHSINVSMYSILIYKLAHPDASPEEEINAGMGGFMHDIGKIKISNRILNKVGKLTESEFQEIRKHPSLGRDFLSMPGVTGPKGSDVEIIKNVVYQHHEHVDGTGYPNKLKGNDIHEMARVTAIADFFDAITTKRSYADVLSVEEAIDLMSKSKGKKIDERLFNLFDSHMRLTYEPTECSIVLPDDFDPCQPHVKFHK